MTSSPKNRIEEEDDERVIADMSSLAPRRPLLFPALDSKPLSKPEKSAEKQSQAPQLNAEQLRYFTKGALMATIAIWAVYALVIGLFIFLLTRIG